MRQTILHAVLAVAVMLAAFAAPALAKEGEKEKDKDPWWIGSLRFDPKVPFDPKEMARLVEAVTPDTRNPRSLVDALMQVTAQKDGKFRALIKREDLRRHRTIEMALCAYDYTINDSEKALARLIELDAEQKLGGDYMSIAIMGMIDEWDRTIDSVWRHAAHSDGAAGTTLTMSFEWKRHLYPESFAKFRASIDTEREVVERVAATVADDPKLSHDRGNFYRFYNVPKGRPPEWHRPGRFTVKELPRKDADSLILVVIGRTWILEPVTEAGRRVWKDVTDQVLPGVEYRSMRLRPLRNENVFETALLVTNEEGVSYFGKRGNDLVWKGGKLVVRKQDEEKFTGFSREPYKSSR